MSNFHHLVSRTRIRYCTALIFMAFPVLCQALPSFARQMNMQCITCHTEYPLLNDMGRQFKLTAYTLSTEQSKFPPIAFMLQPSFTITQARQPGGAAPGFKDNNNYAMSQASIFYAGRLFGPYAKNWFGSDAAAFLNKFGVFSQTTYDGVGKAWSWDNTEFRFADTGKLSTYDLIYGAYLDNNPTLQDPWNSTPAFGFPFSGSGLSPTPAASPMIEGALAGQVGGLGIYTMVDSHFYFDLAAYRTLSPRVQRALGVDPTGEPQITGLAPYWRFAYTRAVSNGSWEIGAFGMSTTNYPGRIVSSGKDRITDTGIDSQFQTSSAQWDLTLLGSVIYENDKWTASLPLENAANASDDLWEIKGTVDFLFDKTYGFALQHFNIRGKVDPVYYGSSQTGSPDSDGFIFQVNYMPFNKRGGPKFWPRSNVKFSVQYVYYDRFDGSTKNIDGAGRSAADNNTFYFESWIVF